ncbi:MAG TPA: TSUP family transporter, partial [Bacteroidota bacterium]|nr:TSUP family transporter [Bacteroidota bacterium]
RYGFGRAGLRPGSDERRMTDLTMSPWLIALITFVTGLVAGILNTIAGGGGMITMPVLLAVGLPPQFALGTNKFQASVGSFTSTWYFVRKGIVRLREIKLGLTLTAVGAVLGSWTVQQIHSEVLADVIPFLLLSIAVYSIFSPALGMRDAEAKMSEQRFYAIFGFGFGFYDGFFGPGVGTFWAMAFVMLLGYNLMKATAYTKVMNFTSNLISFAMFWYGGFVIFGSGIAMAIGQMIGSQIGSQLVMKKGTEFIRPIFITMVLATTLKLIYDRYF